MAKKQKSNGVAKIKKPKGEGRTPRLAGLVDGPFKIYMTTGKKEYDGMVLSSGVIKIDEKEFTSPSSAASYILGKDEKGKPRQVDGWKCWSFNKDGKRVPLDTLRGAKSPLKAVEAKPKVKAAKACKTPSAAKKAKSTTPKPPKARKARKPRPISGVGDSSEASEPSEVAPNAETDIPNEATA